MQLGCYHNHDARPSTNQSEEWHCPACQDLTKEQRETWPRLDGQRKYAVHRAQKRDRGSTLILTAAMQSFSLVITFCSPLSTSLWKWERQAPNLSFAHRLLVLFKLYKYYLRWLTSKLPFSMKCHPVFHISLLRPADTESVLFPEREQPAPPPVCVDNNGDHHCHTDHHMNSTHNIHHTCRYRIFSSQQRTAKDNSSPGNRRAPPCLGF